MGKFFKENPRLVGMILGVLVGIIAQLDSTDWCFYIPRVIGSGMWGEMMASKTEHDEQALDRMALGAFIGAVLGSLMLLLITVPINKLVTFLSTGALIGLAYRWAFKGALIGMILGLFVGIASLFIEGLIGRNLAEVIIGLVASAIIVAHLVASWAAGFWLLFGETPSSSRKHPSTSGES